MTPFATFLVLAGVIFGGPPRQAAGLALALVAATAGFNAYSVRWAANKPEKFLDIRNLRIVLNHSFNVWLIWLLLPHWPPIWMLFLLTMIAVGTYEERDATITHGILLAGLLALVAFLRGVTGSHAWAGVATQGATLVFAGLFCNRLVAQTRSE
jgi:hypothetical protein